MSRPLVVASGGMDSTTAVYKMVQEAGDAYMLSFDYGQRHNVELSYAAKTAGRLGIQHRTLKVPNWAPNRSALTNPHVEVPEGHYSDESMEQTVVPNRNSIFLNIAVGVAMDVGCTSVITAVHAGDHPVYPDCRPEFIDRLNELIYIANEGHGPPAVIAPFMDLLKEEIAFLGDSLDVQWQDTWSCYKGGSMHCGRCSTCVERIEAFANAGVDDPTSYQDHTYWQEVT